MLPNFLKSIYHLRPQYSRKLIILPLATLGIVGFLINTHISFISSNGICYPQTNIVFLKTHKCAGSSIQNILLRYGDKHKLNFVLPRSGNYLGHPSLFSRTMVGPPRSFSFNILAHHTRLNYDEIRAVMPSNSVYITIVRDPIQIFESSYSYYSFDKLFKCDIHKFIRNLPKFSDRFLSRRFRGKFGANQMFFDLGGDPAMFKNTTRILQYLDKLESWFHLVLVAERMDESLVLLRHLLCWDIDDVVTFKLNARNPIYKSNLSETEKEKLLKLNYADALLYNRFVKKFDKEVEAFGRERMEAETAELNKRTLEWYEMCVSDEKPSNKRKKSKHYFNPRVMTLQTWMNVTNETCGSMTAEELPFTERIRQRQMIVYPQSFKPVILHNKTKLTRLSTSKN
ncbi:galactosylceramide sulfotransferase-like [Argiope bruennichi]|nr:galactosylceramide sulfotransferase-like [Argiope bruennichi]XP_055947505.1 galactosylceramide sulfotransferase-like [Argiope bruennichi]XP_055947506.1 galactosylceramide sulfotransferase-like [Argiope bruennichi]